MINFLIKYEKYLAYLGWLIFATVGLLQMFRVKGGFITNYGADIIAPAMLYYSIRINKTILNRIFKKGLNEIHTFILLWILCVGWETLQRFDLSGTIFFFAKGTFDYFDILAYTLTLLACLAISLKISRAL
jgi:hypothetical protein